MPFLLAEALVGDYTRRAGRCCEWPLWGASRNDRLWPHWDGGDRWRSMQRCHVRRSSPPLYLPGL